MEPQRLLPGDPTLVENIVNYLKAKGIFDEFRHECLADVDTKSSCQNLSQRVDGYASKFLANETWHPDMNKNELRNKLRRHIDESGMLAVGADHVVEQVINPKIHQLFLPKIIEVVHQYMREQNETLNKKPEATSSDCNLMENISDASDLSKSKTPVSDPIADILSFSSSKAKSASSSTHGKTDNVVPKAADVPKLEKKKEEKNSPVLEKSTLESPIENPVISPVTEVKPLPEKEKEKIKKEEQELSLDVLPKVIKEEVKPEKKKVEETKVQNTEIKTPLEENKATSLSAKTNVSAKKDDKEKLKSKSVNPHKVSSEIKKPKKELSDKSSEKQNKPKILKPSKELPSPSKGISSVKSASKEEKSAETLKSKSSDSSSSKTSESSVKKSSKLSSDKKDASSSKHKTYKDKIDKNKVSKSSDKSEHSFPPESSNNDKTQKNIHYSSSYDSSQGSDQEKSSSSSSKREKQKHFSKHAKKEKSEKDSDSSSKTSSLKKRSKEEDEQESPSKKLKSEKGVSQEKFKESVPVGEAAKISSRSNSFGSTSSISSASNTSKDNSVSNSEEVSENSEKNKKRKQAKDKEPCHSSKTLPPPPPPPPPTSSLSCELTSSAEMSSMEDTQSSSDDGNSSSEELSEHSSSDSELDSKEHVLSTLNESVLNSSTDDINAFYDIFLYSSSSSEFEGYGLSPEKKSSEGVLEKINESDVSVSSVHTSDLSSFDDELSDEDFVFNDESQQGVKKRLTLKEAQEIIEKRKDFLQTFAKTQSNPVQNKLNEDGASPKTRCEQRSSSLLSSGEESSPSGPARSLRRERKLNPRYASSEYTSIFNSRKETFITKQSSPYVKNQTPLSSPVTEKKPKKEISIIDKTLKKDLSESKNEVAYKNAVDKSVKTKKKASASETIKKEKEFSEDSEMSSSDEMSSIIDSKKLLFENDKNVSDSSSDQLKLNFKFKTQNNSNYSMNSYPVKRKLKYSESAPAKRSCSRGSVDSSSSECVPNENKPFNNENLGSSEEKLIRDGDIKGSNLTDSIKKDLFSKQRINNNGDILGQKDIFSKNSQRKANNASEKKATETENSKELNAL